jgi:hypothetical protein
MVAQAGWLVVGAGGGDACVPERIETSSARRSAFSCNLVDGLPREMAKFFPRRKTGGWNISRALGERHDATRQEFERGSEFTAEGRGARFA